jgi:hypothetical protein
MGRGTWGAEKSQRIAEAERERERERERDHVEVFKVDVIRFGVSN